MNGGDIRFTDADGAELNYWIESWDNVGNSAKIWVKVPSIIAGATSTIRMYYGNPSATSSSNSDATFMFVDDFNTFDTSRWGSKGNNFVSSKLTITSGYVFSNFAVASQPNAITEAKIKWNNFGEPSSWGGHWGGMSIANTNEFQSTDHDSIVIYMLTGAYGCNVWAYATDRSSFLYNIVQGESQFCAEIGTTYILGNAITNTHVIYYNLSLKI